MAPARRRAAGCGAGRDRLIDLRRAEPLEIVRRRERMKSHRKQLALNEIRLRRLAHADADVGLAHRQVEFLVGDQQIDVDVRIELDEFAEPRNQPVHAEARRGGDAQVAVRPLAAVGQLGARGLQLHEHFVRGAIEKFALLGEDQPARMAVEQRHRQFLFERADLARHRRLRQAELLAGMGKASRFGCGVKHLQLVPVHRRSCLHYVIGLSLAAVVVGYYCRGYPPRLRCS